MRGDIVGYITTNSQKIHDMPLLWRKVINLSIVTDYGYFGMNDHTPYSV